MKFPKGVAALGLVLGLATGAQAISFGVEDLGNKFPCTGGCVDTWLVECPDRDTHRITARVRNLLGGNGQDIYEVTAIGITGSLTGEADRELSPSSAGGTSTFSVPAFLTRPGTTKGSTKALVEIGHVVQDAPNAGYVIEFACLDLSSNEVAKRPEIKLLKDQ